MSLVKAAGLIALISLISKFVGLFREIIVSAFYGTGLVRDAYGISSLLPASFALIMLAGLNGPFHSSIVSVISKYKSEGKNQDVKTIVFT
ncbi:MAG: lipid II flippase MurJ, partial [Candidatus Sericytochromatia bacterium]